MLYGTSVCSLHFKLQLSDFAHCKGTMQLTFTRRGVSGYHHLQGSQHNHNKQEINATAPHVPRSEHPI